MNSHHHTLFRSSRLASCILSLLTACAAPVFAQGTAFTYQGRLATNGVPFSGPAEFQFTLWDAASGGAAVATNNPASLIATVDSGLFTATLDFGAVPFNGQARFLQTEVRTSIGPFTTLTSRQELTPTPYAIRAANLTGTLASNSLAGTYGAAVTLNNPANVFNGTFSGNGAGITNLNATLLGGLSASNFWQLNGNASTSPGTHFLGTTDNQPLELRANGQRVLRFEPTTNAPNLIAGFANNAVTPGVIGAVIAGGGGNSAASGVAATNRVTDAHGVVGGGLGNVAGNDNGDLVDARYATVGGGLQNISSGFAAQTGGGYQNLNSGYAGTLGGGFQNTNTAQYATLGGGYQNTNNGFSATLGGGYQNTASGYAATVGGGLLNMAGGLYATVGGGVQNTSSGFSATVPGGAGNVASADYSFAAGLLAKATNFGTFVWADSIGADFTSTANNQFLVRASGGVGINTASPVASLHVNGPIVIQGPALTPGITGSSNLLNLMVGGGSSSIATNGSLNGISFYEAGSAKSMSLGYDGSGSASLNALRIYHSTDAILFTFEASGQMGIGTPAPATALHVRNASDTELSLESADPGAHRWTLQSSRVTGTATDASFQIIDRTAGASRFFIGTNGNVGIRTTAPSVALEVNGVVAATLFQGNGLSLTNVNAITLGGLAASNFWQLGGNAGVTPGANFLGTTDSQPLEFKVNSQRALRLEPTASNGVVNVIAGSSGNTIGSGVFGGTISGGGATLLNGENLTNFVGANFGTVAGGGDNRIDTNAQSSAISGGTYNAIRPGANHSVIGGGWDNDVGTNAPFSVVSGGQFNTARGTHSTVLGGLSNSATNNALAAGRRAKANHQGAFVWGDSTDTDIVSTNANSVTMRAGGGYRLFSNTNATAGVFLAIGGTSWSTLSDRNAKKDFAPINSRAILEKLAALPITQWHYRWETEDAVPHIGPMAQDFKAAFYPGGDDKTISTQELDGVALAAIQGMNQRLTEELKQKQTEITKLELRLEQLERRMNQNHGDAQ